MRLIRFFATDGAVHLGLREGDKVRDLGIREPLDPISPAAIHAAPMLDFAELRLDAPIRSVPKLLALAGNYQKHITESGFSDKAGGVWTPQIFWKPNTAICEPDGAVRLRANNVFFDWEVELAVILSRHAKDVSVSEAMSCVFGYTIMNDLSERKFNSQIANRDLRESDRFFDWLAGKWFDGSAPLGPEIVTVDEISDPHNLPIRLSLNGELMQDSNTRHMIFGIPETISAISAVLTLQPGDVIAMGTPEGVGMARGRALRQGDVLRAEIEGLGVLNTYIV
jgi:2-keto-4-pentenoate hydratase/2-oxohepta-3-ene-1,7-dioic acid hydratase in catechol pathway